MLNTLRNSVEQLKKRVQYNLDIIHKNERIVRKILEEPVSEDRSERLEVKYQENKKLLKENNDSIQLQLQITKFIEAYKDIFETYPASEETHSDIADVEKPLTREEHLGMTIAGEIPFDEDHPYYHDDDFFNQLLEYYTGIEDYETCSYLMKTRQQSENY